MENAKSDREQCNPGTFLMPSSPPIHATDIFVVVVTYNGAKWIERCAASVVESSVKTTLVVVDNNSTDDTLAIVRQAAPEAVILPQSKNLGFGAANNIGISYALGNGAEFVHLMNQDAYVKPDAFAKLVEIANAHPEYGILSPVHIAANENVFEVAFVDYLRRTVDPAFIEDCFFGRLKPVYESDSGIAAHWFIPRGFLMSVGGFSPVFKHTGEDGNMVHRAIFHGFKVGVCPGVVCIHDRAGRKSTKSGERTRLSYNAYTWLLGICCDINIKPSRRFRLAARQFVRMLVVCARNKPQTLPRYVFGFIKAIPKIVRTNRICRRIGPSFLTAELQ